MTRVFLAAAIVLAVLAGQAHAQQQPVEPPLDPATVERVKKRLANARNLGQGLVKEVLAPGMAPTLDLNVPGGFVDDSGLIKARYSTFGDAHSPPLTWKRGPAGTKTYALIMQDAGTRDLPALLHWAVFNIPAKITELPENLPKTNAVPAAPGAKQIRNSLEGFGYLSPGSPGMARHGGYTPQLFALDTQLAVGDDPSLDDLVNAMRGHVLAVGFIEGAVQDPSRSTSAPSPAAQH